MKTSIRSVVALCCAMLCTSGFAEARSGVPPDPDIQCAPSATIFRMTLNGDLVLYNHLEPETGALSWTPMPPTVGRGWQALRPVAAPDGVIYAPHSSGALRRYRWNGSTWDRFPGGVQHEVIETTGALRPRE